MTEAQPRDAGGSDSGFGCEISSLGPFGAPGQIDVLLFAGKAARNAFQDDVCWPARGVRWSSVTLAEGVTGRTRVSYYSPLL